MGSCTQRRGSFADEPAVPRFNCLAIKVKLVVVSWGELAGSLAARWQAKDPLLSPAWR
jgi:hypothetical protein